MNENKVALIIVSSVILAVVLVIGFMVDWGSLQEKSSLDFYYLFNEDVKITKSEKVNWSEWSGAHDRSVKFKIEITKPGYYIFEAWVQQYRDVDALVEKWEFEINEPCSIDISSKHLFYRLEAMRSGEDKKIERANALFSYF